jgi:predicted amidohydrolase
MIVSTISLYWGREHENMNQVEIWIKIAAKRGSKLVVLPHLKFEKGDVLLTKIKSLARENKLYIVVGVFEDRCNLCYLLNPSGEIIGRYQQTHSLGNESLILGNDLPVFETELGNIAMTSGSDHYFFEIYQVLASKGADIITWSDYPGLINDYYPFDLKWSVRAFDYQVYIVTAMYAHDKPVVGGSFPDQPGSPWGRSSVFSPSSVAIADTGCDSGVATGFIDLLRKKRPGFSLSNHFGPLRRFGTPLMQLHYYGDLSKFNIISDPEHIRPDKRIWERTVRVATKHGGQMWGPGSYPDRIIESIKDVSHYYPELVVLSEQSGPDINDPITQEAFKSISDLARRFRTYIVIGGISSDGAPSNVYVWDKDGQIMGYASRTWDGMGSRAFEVLELDFGVIGIKVCGDLHWPSIDRALALKGAEIIVDPSQMWGPNGAFNQLLAQVRSYDNGVWTICSHWAKSDPSLRSYIIDPFGVPIATTRYQESDWAVADIVLGRERPRYSPQTDKINIIEDESTGVFHFESPEMQPLRTIDFEEVFWNSRRPELYTPLFGYEKPKNIRD